MHALILIVFDPVFTALPQLRWRRRRSDLAKPSNRRRDAPTIKVDSLSLICEQGNELLPPFCVNNLYRLCDSGFSPGLT